MTNRVEAAVVNFNAGTHLKVAVDSLHKAGVDKVWVVDNASVDGSSDFIDPIDPKTSVIRPASNLGYGKAVNLAFENMDCQYVLVCNPDIEVLPGAIEQMVGELEKSIENALVGPKILNSDGSIYPSVRCFPSLIDAGMHALLGQIRPNNSFTRRYRMMNFDHDSSVDADWVSGACMLVRSEVFRTVGGFNPAFFMYLEDVFLCRQVGLFNYKVRYCGKAEVIHAQGVTTRSRPLRMVVAHHKSLWIYAKLTRDGWHRIELIPIGFGIVARLLISVVLTISKREIKKPRIDLN